MTRPLRVILDTNVVLSALVFGGGKTAAIRALWSEGALVPLVSTATAGELIRVLAYPKFRLSVTDQEELLADFLPHTEICIVPSPPPSVPYCRDANDLPFMHLAVAAKVDALVSGDRDLLTIADEYYKACGVRILTMEEIIGQCA